MERRRLAIGLWDEKRESDEDEDENVREPAKTQKKVLLAFLNSEAKNPSPAPTSLPPGARQHVSVRGVVWGAPARAPESVAREPGLERRDRGKSRVATSESGGGGVPEMSPLRFGGCVRA